MMNLAGTVSASTSTVLLVEGESDRVAVEALATRLGLPLVGLGVQVVAMGGITNIGHYLVALAGREPGTDDGRGLRLGGLYDVAEERFVVKGLDRVGLRPSGDTTPLPALGFFRCERDLEDELVRAAGTERLLALIEAEGELRGFERLRGQPAQSGWTTTRLLHRFLGSKGGRKERYARRLVEVVPLERVPAPLAAVLHWATHDAPPAVSPGVDGPGTPGEAAPVR
jgi:hypothetical protein